MTTTDFTDFQELGSEQTVTRKVIEIAPKAFSEISQNQFIQWFNASIAD